MDAIDEAMTFAKSWNAATPREMPPQGEEQVMESLSKAHRRLNELMLLDSVALDPAAKVLRSLHTVVLFIEEVPGKLTPEVDTQFMETMSDYTTHFAHYLLLARLDLGITELTVQKTSEAPST